MTNFALRIEVSQQNNYSGESFGKSAVPIHAQDSYKQFCCVKTVQFSGISSRKLFMRVSSKHI